MIHIDFSQEEWENELVRVIDLMINEDKEIYPNAPKGAKEGWTRKDIVEYEKWLKTLDTLERAME
jgi:hypothetical protein